MDECVLCHKNFDGVPGLKHPVCATCAYWAWSAYQRDQDEDVFRWTMEIEVARDHVADGLDITEERLRSALGRAWPFANMNSITCRVIDAPDPKRIRVAQGYKDVASPNK